VLPAASVVVLIRSVNRHRASLKAGSQIKCIKYALSEISESIGLHVVLVNRAIYAACFEHRLAVLIVSGQNCHAYLRRILLT
jgi:hypothetical protein